MRTLSLVLISFAATPAASEFSLTFPVACTLGENCYIQNYVDHDPSSDTTDFTCNQLSYDGHKGTDIALFSHKDLKREVSVMAAADGRVTGLRDNMQDHRFLDLDQSAFSGRECGNGVVITHSDGWETQYCHLKQNSISVTLGEQVHAGQMLGNIGASGYTAFPHLHLSLRKDGQVVDPFVPGGFDNCQANSKGLWAEEINYVAGGLIATNIDDKVPDYSALKVSQDRSEIWPSDSPALVVWSFGFGLRPKDQIHFSLIGPEGQIFAQSHVADRHRAQFFFASGKRIPKEGWLIGTYTGQAQLERDDAILDTQSFTFEVQ